MKVYLSVFLVFLIHASDAHHEVHLVPAHKICPNVKGDQDILLPDPRDCAVYYRCEDGAAVPQSCPPGLHWCQILQNCTLPVLANCTLTHVPVTYSPEELVTWHPGPVPNEETCPKNGESIPYAGDCSKYYKCVDGHPEQQSCPADKHYNTWLGICTAPEIANCIEVGTQENKTCPLNGARKIYPTDCNKYYECVDNKVQIKHCPENLEYNEWFEGCYSSNVAYCHTYTTVTPTEPTTINTPSPEEDLCPGTGFTLPNPLNCTTYFYCKGSTSTLENCPEGYYYSCWDLQCLPPSDGSCLPTEKQNCNEPGQKLPHSEDCSSYYECVNGVTQKVECKDGLQFNAWFGKCVNSSLAHCKSETSTVTTITQPSVTSSPSSTEDVCPLNGATLPDPLDCNSFFTCNNTTPVLEKCPSNYVYSCWDQECLPPESANCVKNDQLGQTCTNNGSKLQHTDDCSSYYECENGKVVLKHCDSGLEYNAWFEKCVETSLSHCKSTISTKPGVTTPPTGPGVTTPPTGPEVTTPPTGSGVTTPPTGPPSLFCPVPNLMYPHLTKCNAYSKCDSNRQLQTIMCDPIEFFYNCETKKCENITHCCSPHHTTTGPGVTTPPTGPGVTTPPTGPGVTTPPTGPGVTTPPTGPGVTTPPTGPGVTTLPPGVTTPTGPGVTTPPTGPGITTPPTGPGVTTLPPGVTTPTGPGVTTPPTGPGITTPPTGPGVTTPPPGVTTPTGPGVTMPPTGPGVTTPPTGPGVTTPPPGVTTPTGPGVTTPPTGPGITTPPTGPGVTTPPPGVTTPTGPGVTTPPTGPGVTTPPTGPGVTTLPPGVTTPTGPGVTTSPTGPGVTTPPTGPGITTPPPGVTTPTDPGVTTPPTGPGVTTPPTGPGITTPTTGPGVTTPPTGPGVTTPPTGPGVTTPPTGPGVTTPPTGPGVTTPPPGVTTPTGPGVTTPPTEPGVTTPPTGPGITTPPTGPGVTTPPTGPGVTTPPPGVTTPTGPGVTTPPTGPGVTTPPTGPGVTTPPTGPGVTTPPTGPGVTTPPTGPGVTTPPTGPGVTTPPTGPGVTTPPTGPGVTTPPTGPGVTTPPTGPPSPFCPVPNLMYPHLTLCNAYSKCDSNRQLQTIMCDPIEFNYNCETKKCENITHCCSPGHHTPKPTTPTPKPTPGLEDICPLEGALLPNPTDCMSYYICKNKTAEPITCPTGLEYSCWNQRCENPKDASCIKDTHPGQECSNNDESLPNIADCSSYYKCVNGKVQKELCASGKFYNQWFETCTSVSASHCKTYPPDPTIPSTPSTASPSSDNNCPVDGVLIPNPLNCSTYFECIEKEPKLQSCPSGEIYSCWDQQCETPILGQCVTNTHDGEHCSIDNVNLTNTEDCKSYYACENGTVVSKKCPPNTSYNSWYHKCVDSKYSHCHIVTTEPTTPTPTKPSVTIPPNATEEVCPLEGAILPNPRDCHSYFACVNGTPESQKCPNGEEYSCWDQQCENSEHSVCIKEGSQQGNKCSKNDVSQQNVEDCSSYYKCVNGIIQLQYCPKGKVYNKWYHECLPDSLAHCQIYPTIEPSVTHGPPLTTVSPNPSEDICPLFDATLPNPLNCTTYFKCLNEQPTLVSCPTGEGYSCWNQRCEPEALDQCVPNGDIGESCSLENLNLPNIKDCSGYLTCKNGTVVEESCPSGTKYNSWFKKCVKSDLAHCAYSTAPPPSTTTSESTPTPSVPTNITPPPPGTCPIGDAKLPNPLDCKSYFVCDNGEIVSKRCPAGEIYSCWDQKCENPIDGTCINEGNLVGHKCSENGIQLPDISDCSKYYECVNGTVEIKTCASKTSYNKWLKICIPAKLDTCITYSTVEPPTTSGSTLPTSPNPEYNVCPLEGALLPNPLDCSTYYECINGVPTLQTCPGGMEYSCWDQQCENDTDASCVTQGVQNGNNCSIEGLRITDVSHCANYYECDNGTIIRKQCPPGEEFNSAFQDCYKPKLAHCVTNTPMPPVTDTTPTTTPNLTNNVCPTEGSLLPNPLNCSAYYKCINGTPTPQQCAEGYEYSCWNQECEPAGEAKCISQGNQNGVVCKYNGQTVQNPTDCHTYYKCVNGNVQLKRCIFNWYYNKWFNICTPLKILSHCEAVTLPPTSPTPPTTTTQAPEINKDICPLGDALLPNPLDCTSYFKCENNIPVSQKCPSGQAYSCWDQQCEDAAKAQCINVGVDGGQNCSRDGVRLPDLTSCNNYYECKNGKAQKNFCFIGFQYNKWYQKCVLFPYAHCKTYPTVTPTLGYTPTPTTTEIPSPSESYDLCPIDGTLLPNPVDCTKYYKCLNNTPTIESCPDGQEYSCWDQKCENDTDANCIASSQAGARCTIDGLKLSKIDNCSSYYECVNGSVTEKQCKPGQEFNDRFQHCYKPDLAHCSPHKTSPPPGSTVSPPTKPSPHSDICPEEGTLLPNPLNCSTYYKCINGTPTLELCADDYEYSCWDQECEPADKAQCIAEGPGPSNYCEKNGQKNQDITNCHRYLECVNHQIIIKTCILNWYYNKWFHTCVPLKELAYCNQTTTLAPVRTTVTTPKPSSGGTNCPINNQTIPDPTDCSKYLECVKNKQTSRSCPGGQKYSAWDQGCKPAEQVQCYNIGSPSGQNCSRDGVTLQNLKSCTSFYECESGIVQEHYCFMGSTYNRWYQNCQLDLFSSCKTYSTFAPPTTTANPVTRQWYLSSSCPKNGKKAPNIKNCNTYYVCDMNHVVLYNCPPGTNYDSWSQSCQPTSSARCANNPSAWEGQSCPKDGDSVPNPTSCSSYYTCKGHSIKKSSCYFLQYYDVWNGNCKFFGTCASNIVL